MAESTPSRIGKQGVAELQELVRKLAKLADEYRPAADSPYLREDINGFDIKLQGFSKAKLSLAVYKEPISKEYALEQATYMMFLGEGICPKIFAINDTGYAMEYLQQPGEFQPFALWDTEYLLEKCVWNRRLEDSPFAKLIGDLSWKDVQKSQIGIEVPDWALDIPCLIHGDPTIDNTLKTNGNGIRLTDPIPPHRLNKPSIKAVDHGKILQSMLGWEVVLRGIPRIDYAWPKFMGEYNSARRALFWAMVSVKRIGYHNWDAKATEWSKRVGGELECALLS
jgi:hypothetical protein